MIHRARRLGASAVLLAALLAGGAAAPAAFQQDPAQQESVFVCPMHADVRSAVPGTCPVCGMALVSTDPERAYDLQIRTAPRQVRAGQPFRLQLTVRDARTSTVVKQFTEVHERRFHMFVISQDLEHYDHVHPEQLADGSWALDLTVPRPGRYNIYSDFFPEGGTPQVIRRSLVTADYTGDLASAGARLTPDSVLRQTVGSMSVVLELPVGGVVAGREATLTYWIADARTGAPVTDLEPYLGAWGHSLLTSEDTKSVVHAHPVEHVPHEPESRGGGPTLTFKALLPQAGHYRIWTQLKRDGSLETSVFTITVAPG